MGMDKVWETGSRFMHTMQNKICQSVGRDPVRITVEPFPKRLLNTVDRTRNQSGACQETNIEIMDGQLREWG